MSKYTISDDGLTVTDNTTGIDRALKSLAEPAPMQEPETVSVYGVKSNGEVVDTCVKAPMPPRMKAKDMVREMFGPWEEDDGSDSDLCFAVCESLLDWLVAQGWTAQQPAPVQEPDAIGCKCSVCGEWQRWTPSGMVCKNGHGGADGINHRLYTQPRKAVKLSDSEVREIYENHAYVDCTGMLRAIEAAVWEKLGVTE